MIINEFTNYLLYLNNLPKNDISAEEISHIKDTLIAYNNYLTDFKHSITSEEDQITFDIIQKLYTEIEMVTFKILK